MSVTVSLEGFTLAAHGRCIEESRESRVFEVDVQVAPGPEDLKDVV